MENRENSSGFVERREDVSNTDIKSIFNEKTNS